MRPAKIVKCLKEDLLFAQVVSFLTEAKSLSGKWGDTLAERQIQPLQQSCADFSAYLCKPI